MTDPATVTAALKAASTLPKSRPWATVEQHDALIQDEYEDLITWAQDDARKEAKALRDERERASRENYLYGGHFGLRLTEIRDEFALRWRDRKRSSDRTLRKLREQESAAVAVWRKVEKKPWPQNPHEEELLALTAAWENEDVRREAVQREIEGCREAES